MLVKSLQSWVLSNFVDDSFVQYVLKSGRPVFGSTLAKLQDFYQISNFDSLYLYSSLTYRESQYLFRKILTSSVDTVP